MCSPQSTPNHSCRAWCMPHLWELACQRWLQGRRGASGSARHRWRSSRASSLPQWRVYAETCGSWPASDDCKDGVVHQVVRVIVGDHREQARSHSGGCMQKPVGAGLPAMIARTARCIRLCASSLAIIASRPQAGARSYRGGAQGRVISGPGNRCSNPGRGRSPATRRGVARCGCPWRSPGSDPWPRWPGQSPGRRSSTRSLPRARGPGRR